MVISREPIVMHDPEPVATVRQFGTLPRWLAAALDTEQVMTALNRHVPEFASEVLRLRDCTIDLLHLKDKGEWGRNWLLTIADADGERLIPIRVTLFTPGLSMMKQTTTDMPLESSDWRCWLPELGLLCQSGRSKKEKELPSLKALTDAEQARPFLEQALRGQATGYEQVAIRSCTPDVVFSKPGKSAVIRYKLDYGFEGSGPGWQETVILKAYSDDIGHNTFVGMRAIWDTELRNSAVVRVPEPLAYLADQQATLMGPVPEETNLEKFLDGLLLSNDSADQGRLHEVFRAAGVALAAFHRCGGTMDRTTTWTQGFAEAAEQLARLRVPFPQQIAAADRLVERLCALEASVPADPFVPTHGAFRPEQVLLAGKQISFIDFDNCCMAEPAFDLALFRATMMDSGLYGERIRPRDKAEVELRRTRIDALSESFLASYESHAPVSRQRVALWEAIFYFTDSLQCWTKPRPDDPRLVVFLLERHLQTLGIVS